MPLVLWCHSCCTSLCRACASADHASHKIKSQGEAKEQLVAEMQVELASMNKVKDLVRFATVIQEDG